MLESELVSLDKEPKPIQWPPQQELTADDDVLRVGHERKLRQKFVYFYCYSSIRYTLLLCDMGFSVSLSMQYDVLNLTVPDIFSNKINIICNSLNVTLI